MTVTKAHLESKLADLGRRRDQLTTDLNVCTSRCEKLGADLSAHNGAIEILTQLIAECEAPEHPPETAQPGA